MKCRTIQKEVKANYSTIISVPYCSLQHLLAYESPIAYTKRREGWAADIYDVGGGVAIATGCAPFGNIRPTYEQLKAIEERAERIRYNYDLTFEQVRDRLKSLLQEFTKGAH